MYYAMLWALIVQLTSNNKPKFCTEIEINLYQPENYTSFYCVEIIQGVISTDLRTDFSKTSHIHSVEYTKHYVQNFNTLNRLLIGSATFETIT